MTKPTGRPRGRPRKRSYPKPQEASAITTAPVVDDEEALVDTERMRAERRRMHLCRELEGLFSRSVLSYRPTELFRKAMLEGDLERARMIVEVASEFFPAQAEELAELAKEHLPDESEPGVREGISYADGLAGFFGARRKLQQSTPKRHGP